MIKYNKKTALRKRGLMQALLKMIKVKALPKVSVVILAHNNWHFTKQCLHSVLYESRYPHLEVIVVNNGSTDETQESLSKDEWQDVINLTSPVNLGFAGGNNLGLTQASGEYFILLNNDTIVSEGWIERLITPIARSAKIGLVGPLTNCANNEQQIIDFDECTESGPDKHWFCQLYLQRQGKIRYTHFLAFFCVAMRKDVYQTVGVLDENYLIGMFEDNDYCVRVVQAGYRIAIVEDAFVYHHGSVTLDTLGRSEFKDIYKKNEHYFLQRWGRRGLAHLRYINRVVRDRSSARLKKT